MGGAAPRLLVVDDEVELCRLFATIGEEAGYEVRGETSVAGFRRAFGDFRPDVILLDVYLSESEDGIDLMSWLCQQQFAGRVIAVSGGGEYLELVELVARRAGFAGQLTCFAKPVSAFDLLAQLESPGQDEG